VNSNVDRVPKMENGRAEGRWKNKSGQGGLPTDLFQKRPGTHSCTRTGDHPASPYGRQPFPSQLFHNMPEDEGKSSHTVSTGRAAASGRLCLSTLCCAYLHQNPRSCDDCFLRGHSRINSQPLRECCGCSCREPDPKKKSRKWFHK
jgi:hypothetical protein